VDFLRLMPQKIPDYRAAQTFGLNAVCRVKNRFSADFFGVLCAKRNKLLDKAIADFTQVIRINPNDAKMYNNRGNAYDDKGELDMAIVDYNQALRI
jgi:tetratricopeptide (TPR) repeat protein